MDTVRLGTRGIVALLPFLVKNALSLSVLRAMRDRGYDITLVYFHPGAHGYTPDIAADFEADGRLLDFSVTEDKACLTALDGVIAARGVGLVLQIGAPDAYAMLPYLKERHPHMRVVDTMYNEVGHAVDHFLYETCLDAVIVESDYMRRFIERRSAKVHPNVLVVESGIDLARYAPRPAGPPRNGLVLGYIGRMSPEKNPMGFVTLAERLAKDHLALSFLMFGEGGMSDDVKARVASSGLGTRIRFEGYVEDQRDALAQIDALVVPSKLDGRPNIIMEANAFGRPVLAAPVGGIPGLIKDGCNGHLVSPDDGSSLSAIVHRWEADRPAFTAPQSCFSSSVWSRRSCRARAVRFIYR